MLFRSQRRADKLDFIKIKTLGSFAAAAKSLQSCPTLCDPIDGSPPRSSVPGILQARTLEWVAIAFSHSSALAWKVPWTEEPGRLQPMGSLRVGYD